jgi:SAM-dependent methyltransferase
MAEKTNDYYKSNWDAYYESIGNKTENIPWDVTPDLASVKDFDRMKGFFNSNLPVIDIGCGVGTQTVFLNREFKSVIGTDVSDGAVEIARKKFKDSGVEFRQLDVLNRKQVSQVHGKFGDCNVYMRGTLQQILHGDRKAFSASMDILLGSEGRLYFVELSTEAQSFFLDLHRKLGGLPPELKRVLAEKVTKMVGVGLEEVDRIFDKTKFKINGRGKTTIALKVNKEECVYVPAVYGLISKA